MQTPSSNQRPGVVAIFFTALIPLAITTGGAFLLSHAGPRLIEGLAARSWAEAPGQVIDARAEEVDRGGSGPGTKRWFEIHVAYAFDAGGETHRGDRVGLWPERLLWPYARERAAEFPPGHPVRVYYDPADPTRSLLDRTLGSGTWAMVIGGVPVLGLGLLTGVGFVRSVRSGDPPR